MDSMKNRVVMCIDLKSFYASVECVLHGLDPRTAKLAVAGDLKRESSIILAASIGLKKLGVKNRGRLFEIPKKDDILVVRARMKKYLEFSTKINSVYLKYVHPDDIYIYSIDETFLDITKSMHLFAKTPKQFAIKIMREIFQTIGIPSACGIGENMLMAKLALDIEAKSMPNNISYWTKSDLPSKLWTITNLTDMWGIGGRMEKRLRDIGIFSIGDLANYNRKILIEKFGVMGAELQDHANGIDTSIISNKGEQVVRDKSYGAGQTLYQDYYENAVVILHEIVDEIAMRLRRHNAACQVVSISIGYSKAIGGGFSRQMKIPATALYSDITGAVDRLFYKNYKVGTPIRKVNVSVSGLVNINFMQQTLFKNIDKEMAIATATDNIKDKFGKTAVLRATSYTKSGNARFRSTLVGGHNAEIGSEDNIKAAKDLN